MIILNTDFLSDQKNKITKNNDAIFKEFAVEKLRAMLILISYYIKISISN